VPKFINSLAYHFIQKKVQKEAKFNLNSINLNEILLKTKYKPNIYFLHGSQDELICL